MSRQIDNSTDAEIKRSRIITDEILGFLEAQYPGNAHSVEVALALSASLSRLAVDVRMPMKDFLEAMRCSYEAEIHRKISQIAKERSNADQPR